VRVRVRVRVGVRLRLRLRVPCEGICTLAGVVGAVVIVDADGCGGTGAASEAAGAAAGCGATTLPAAGMARRTMVMPSRTGSMTCSVGVRD